MILLMITALLVLALLVRQSPWSVHFEDDGKFFGQRAGWLGAYDGFCVIDKTAMAELMMRRRYFSRGYRFMAAAIYCFPCLPTPFVNIGNQLTLWQKNE